MEQAERRGELLGVGGAETDGSGLSSLISPSQRYLTFLRITSRCYHPASVRVGGRGAETADQINNGQE